MGYRTGSVRREWQREVWEGMLSSPFHFLFFSPDSISVTIPPFSHSIISLKSSADSLSRHSQSRQLRILTAPCSASRFVEMRAPRPSPAPPSQKSEPKSREIQAAHERIQRPNLRYISRHTQRYT